MFDLLLDNLLGLIVLSIGPIGGYIADVKEGRRDFARRFGGRVKARSIVSFSSPKTSTNPN